MREHGLLAPSRVGSTRESRTHDGTIIPETVDTMWGTDLTATFTGESQAAVFIAVDPLLRYQASGDVHGSLAPFAIIT